MDCGLRRHLFWLVNLFVGGTLAVDIQQLFDWFGWRVGWFADYMHSCLMGCLIS